MRQISLKIGFSIALLIGILNGMFSQTKVSTKLAKFLIFVETTNDGIMLTSQEGCAWKTLNFTLKTDNVQAIDERGMTSLKRDKPTKDRNLVNFLFTIKKTKDGLSFEGTKGTAWEKLTYSCLNNCRRQIDQNGITEAK